MGALLLLLGAVARRHLLWLLPVRLTQAGQQQFACHSWLLLLLLPLGQEKQH